MSLSSHSRNNRGQFEKDRAASFKNKKELAKLGYDNSLKVQGLKNSGALAQQKLQNTGSYETQRLRNTGGLASQKLANEGALATTRMKEIGAMARSMLSGDQSMDLAGVNNDASYRNSLVMGKANVFGSFMDADTANRNAGRPGESPIALSSRAQSASERLFGQGRPKLNFDDVGDDGNGLSKTKKPVPEKTLKDYDGTFQAKERFGINRRNAMTMQRVDNFLNNNSMAKRAGSAMDAPNYTSFVNPHQKQTYLTPFQSEWNRLKAQPSARTPQLLSMPAGSASKASANNSAMNSNATQSKQKPGGYIQVGDGKRTVIDDWTQNSTSSTSSTGSRDYMAAARRFLNY